MGVLSTTHPDFDNMVATYNFMLDSYGGSRYIKAARAIYLSPTPSMIIDGWGSTDAKCPGNIRYEDYIRRARYPEYVKEGVNNMVGLMHSKPGKFELPESMKYLLEKASPFGESLEFVLRKINMYQLLYARLAIVVDLPAVESHSSKPYLAVYSGLACRNWYDGTDEDDSQESLTLAIFDESGYKFDRDTFTYTAETRYRILQLESDPVTGKTVYKQGLFIEDSFNPEQMIAPKYAGKTLDSLPCVYVTDVDVTTDVHEPPLRWLADMCVGIYCSEADYRQSLWMQSQDTLVIKNGNRNEEDVRTGAGAVIHVDGTDGDAKYIGVSSKGLEEQRVAIDNDKQEASYRAGQFIGTKQAAQESGEAMQTRIAARTITLGDIADAGAAGLQKALRSLAAWMGEDPETVKVTPNKDFAKKTVSGQDLVQIVTARNLGAPISKESIHKYCSENGLTVLTFDEEMALLKKEVPGEVPPLSEQTDTSTGISNMANQNTPNVPEPGKTNVDSRS